MYGYQQTAFNYGTYSSANGQQAGFVGYNQQSNAAAAATGAAVLTNAATAYANSPYSLAASAYAHYGQAAQQQSASAAAGYGGIQPPPPPNEYQGTTPAGAYGVIGAGKTSSANSAAANAVASGHYAGYEAAVYAAASNYIQTKSQGGANTWAQKGKGQKGPFQKKRFGLGHQNRDVQQYFCELCKISCAGQVAYKDHLEGKPHKKKEQAAKQTAGKGVGHVAFRCEVCELSCSSKDTYDAHVKGQKHQRTIAVLRRMGKPVPQMEVALGPLAAEQQGKPIPTVGSSGPLKKVVGVTGTKFVGGTTLTTTGEEMKISSVNAVTGAVKPQDLEKALLGNEDVKPVGQEFIEEEKDPQGKFLTYMCKLCDCKFSDRGAKDIHLKGRRHRLQYKQKVDPSLRVEVKGTWGKSAKNTPSQPYVGAYSSGFRPPPQQPRPLFPMPRHQEVMDDKHVMAKLQQIQLSIDEVRAVERLALLTEKTLKSVSDSMVTGGDWSAEQQEQQRMLKGVMRVGLLAKNLLLKSDKQIDLVVLCSKIPSLTLLNQVADLFRKYAEVPAEDTLTVLEMPQDSALSISLGSVSVSCRVTLTSVALREGTAPAPQQPDTEEEKPPVDPLPRDPCLNALAELRHAKFYQVKCAPLHSMNTAVKVVRDIGNRVRTWAPMHAWTIELLVEKALSSVAMALSPGDAIRRLFEVISSGVFLGKRSKLLDPCEKEPTDVLGHITDQEREDITSSAQHALRLINYNQIYKILAINRQPDPRPPRAMGGGGAGLKRARGDGSPEGGRVGQADGPGQGQGHPGTFAPSADSSASGFAAPDSKKGKTEQQNEEEAMKMELDMSKTQQ